MAVKYDPILDALREDDSTGSSDTATNIGTGVGIFANKTSGVFNFNSLANSTTITVSTASGGNITLHLSSVPPALIPDPLSVNNLNVYSTATITLIDAIDITTNTLFTNYVDFDLLQTTAPIEGRAIWNDDSKTLELGLKGGFPLEVGMQMVELCVNKTGSTISKGKVVYINGGQGNRPTITLADNSSDATSARTFGIVAEDIPNNNSGYVVVSGLVTGLNTNAYTAGTQLYLSTNGDMTSTKPVAPAHMVYVARVITQSSTVGVVYVGVMNGLELEELHDVSITSLANKDTISWDSTTSLWKNKSIATLKTDLDLSGTNSGDVTVTDSSTIDFTLTGQALTGSVIESGITHNNLGSLQGGTAGEYNHITNAQLTVLQNTSGTNTGDITVTDSSTIDFTLTGQALTGSVIQSGITHNNLSGLTTGDPHTQYVLLAGRSGGQIIAGGTVGSQNLTLRSTAGGTPGIVYIQDLGGRTIFGGVIQTPNGSITAPSHSFSTETTSGLYFDSTKNAVVMATQSSNSLFFRAGRVNLPDGSVSSPALGFESLDVLGFPTGIYRDGSDFAFSVLGEKSVGFGLRQIRIQTGSAIEPGMCFEVDFNGGLYYADTTNGAIGLSVFQTEIFRAGLDASGFNGIAVNSTALNTSMLYLNQNLATRALPVVRIQQSDLSEEFIDFRATNATGNPVNTTALGTYYGRARVSVNGVFKWVALYNT